MVEPIGTAPHAKNINSTNFQVGILFNGSGASYNVVQGNRVGTDIIGTVAPGSSWGGVSIRNGAG